MCEDQVLPLAVNLMDRFLCVCNIKRQQLQLLGATCLLIASKVRSTNVLPVYLLCAYTDYSVSCELLVVSFLMLIKLRQLDRIYFLIDWRPFNFRIYWGHFNNS
jgi:hypothetical protein